MQHTNEIRRTTVQDHLNTIPQATWLTGHTIREIEKLQTTDSSISKLLQWKARQHRPIGTEICSASPEVRHYWNYWDSLEVHGHILFKRTYSADGGSSKLQLVVPKSMRDTILRQMHNDVTSGHLGQRKTIEKVRHQYYWYLLREEIHDWINSCDICAANKLPCKKPKARLGDMRVGAPMDRWAIDILGPLPVTSRNNRYVMVVTDAFSKWTEAFALPDQTAETCTNCLVQEMICRFGSPLDLLCDQGRNWESQIFKELCKLLNIRKLRTTPRHPMGNGQVERYNKTLIPMIRPYLKGDQTTWDLNLALLTAAYRATVHDTTNYTPNMLMLGREVHLPGNILMEDPSPVNSESYGSYVQQLKQTIDKAHDTNRKHLQKHAQTQQDRYDAKASKHYYQRGDYVWYLTEIRKEGVNPKLQSPYDGPFLITKVFNLLDYKIQMDKRGRQRVVHYNKLKPYCGKNIPIWM